MKIFLLTLLFSAMISGCSLGGSGTDTGNPKLRALPDSQHDPLPPPPPEIPSTGFAALASDEILISICRKLSACNPTQMTTSSCEVAVLKTSSIDTELGLPLGYGNYASIVNAERAGTLQRGASTSACVTSIDNYSCSSTAVVASYDSSNPGDFDDVYRLLDPLPSCSEVFDP